MWLKNKWFGTSFYFFLNWRFLYGLGFWTRVEITILQLLLASKYSLDSNSFLIKADWLFLMHDTINELINNNFLSHPDKMSSLLANGGRWSCWIQWLSNQEWTDCHGRTLRYQGSNTHICSCKNSPQICFKIFSNKVLNFLISGRFYFDILITMVFYDFNRRSMFYDSNIIIESFSSKLTIMQLSFKSNWNFSLHH